MMSKERLEEIVEKISEQTFDRITVPQTKITIEYQDIKFLINAITKQTERVQELEELLTQIKYDKEAHISLSEKYLKKQLQNKRYREALEFYADEENYLFDEKEYKVGLGVPESEITLDYGNKAREALEDEECVKNGWKKLS